MDWISLGLMLFGMILIGSPLLSWVTSSLGNGFSLPDIPVSNRPDNQGESGNPVVLCDSRRGQFDDLLRLESLLKRFSVAQERQQELLQPLLEQLVFKPKAE